MSSSLFRKYSRAGNFRESPENRENFLHANISCSTVSTVQTKKVKIYNSFVPKTTRECNLLSNDLHMSVSSSTFKSCSKKHFMHLNWRMLIHVFMKQG